MVMGKVCATQESIRVRDATGGPRGKVGAAWSSFTITQETQDLHCSAFGCMTLASCDGFPDPSDWIMVSQSQSFRDGLCRGVGSLKF